MNNPLISPGLGVFFWKIVYLAGMSFLMLMSL